MMRIIVIMMKMMMMAMTRITMTLIMMMIHRNSRRAPHTLQMFRIDLIVMQVENISSECLNVFVFVFVFLLDMDRRCAHTVCRCFELT